MAIALITDFGTRDYYVGAMKGTILSINPTAAIVDITHDVEPQNIRQAAFILASCFRDFPPATVFVCVVDPGVGSDRRGVAAAVEGREFVCPDNGLLSLLDAAPTSVHELREPQFQRSTVSSTFHGRDIFAPAAAHLSLGTLLAELGPEVPDLVTLPVSSLVLDGDQLCGSVLHIDRFGNIVSNIRPDAIDPSRGLRINGQLITSTSRSYAEAADDQPFMICGSAGFVEISVNGASAADRLGAVVGDMVIASPAARRDER